MTPYFHKSHPLPLIFENLHGYFTKKFARFARISKILAIFDENDEIRSKILENYTRWPPFLGIITEKRSCFLDHTPNDPLFYGWFVTDRPLIPEPGRRGYVTFICECPPGHLSLATQQEDAIWVIPCHFTKPCCHASWIWLKFCL